MDIRGNTIATIDGLGRTILLTDYDICGEKIHTLNMDSGEEWTLINVVGQPLLKWNSRDFRFRFKLRRLIETWLSQDGSTEVLTDKVLYGDLAPDPDSHNLRGEMWQISDQAGIITQNAFDFSGNLLSSTRQLAKNYKDTLDHSQLVEMEDELYNTTVSYDALNRPVRTMSSDRSITYRMYNETKHLDKTFVNIRSEQDPAADPTTWTPIITDVQYNAREQVASISYGNGAMTIRTYDPLLFRLERLQTLRPSSSGGALQDLHYTYDPFGNITHLQDSAQQIIFFNNSRIDPSSDYTYDPIYRLIAASGREHLGQSNGAPNAPTNNYNVGLASPGDGNAMEAYTEIYQYDAAGNISSTSHAGSDPRSGGWKRAYAYNEPSLIEPGKQGNRLSATMVGAVTQNYGYGGNAGLTGNITAMPHLSVMQWTYKDTLKATSKQVVANGNTPEITYYVYDYKGERVRKVTESQAGAGSAPTPTRMKERIYFKEIDTFRKYDTVGSAITLERATLKVTDETGHIANIETRTQGTDDGMTRLIRYQLKNLIGSSCIEFDDASRIISYEEYFPFGSTSYQAVASQTETPKRYRYSGKELDDENGLYYYGARYYVAWMSRWISADPVNNGTNLYEFVLNNPVRLTDPDGRKEEDETEPDVFQLSIPAVDGPKIKINTGTLGTYIHNILLHILQMRLAKLGVRSVVE